MKRLLMATVATAISIGLAACGLALKKDQIAASGPFEAKVFPAGPPTWTYEIETDQDEGITSVWVLTGMDREDVRIEPDATPVPSTWVVKDHMIGVETYKPDGVTRLSFSLTAEDATEGEVFLRVEDSNGLTTTIGPVVGPQS